MQLEKATFLDLYETNGMQSCLNDPYFAYLFTSDAFLGAVVVLVTIFLFREFDRLDAYVSLQVTLVFHACMKSINFVKASVSARENKFIFSWFRPFFTQTVSMGCGHNKV